jgi:hypothetical protein
MHNDKFRLSARHPFDLTDREIVIEQSEIKFAVWHVVYLRNNRPERRLTKQSKLSTNTSYTLSKIDIQDPQNGEDRFDSAVLALIFAATRQLPVALPLFNVVDEYNTNARQNIIRGHRVRGMDVRLN